MCVCVCLLEYFWVSFDNNLFSYEILIDDEVDWPDWLTWSKTKIQHQKQNIFINFFYKFSFFSSLGLYLYIYFFMTWNK